MSTTPDLPNLPPSGLERIRGCPGSYHAGRQIKGTSSPAADLGRQVHAILEKAITLEALALDDITHWTEECAGHLASGNETQDERASFIAGWFARIVQRAATAGGGAVRIEKEFTVTLTLEAGATVRGIVDLEMDTADGKTHQIDYKSGGAQVDTADDNLQMQAYAIARLDADPDLEAVTSHIISAGNEGDEKHTFSDYTRNYLEMYRQELERIATAAIAEDAPRIIHWYRCQYCSARGTRLCPESQKALHDFAQRVARMESPAAVFGDQEPDQRGKTVAFCKTVKAVADMILGSAVPLLKEDEDAITGWTLTPDTQVREIHDVQEAYKLLAAKGVSREQFMDKVKVSLTGCRAAYYDAEKTAAEQASAITPTKASTQRQADAILEPVIVKKDRSGWLTPKKDGNK